MEKINILELLKDCPAGMELDCLLFDGVILDEIDDDEYCGCPIVIKTKEGETWNLTSTGCWDDSPSAKCVIFPKGKNTWEGFHRPFVDGDIVAIDSAAGSQVFIFEEYIRGEKDYAYCYLMLDDNGAVDLERGEYYVERFASREEQERLFEAIKEKGYRWDPVNNTLEKLIELRFKVGDMIRHKNQHEVYLVSEVRDNHYLLDERDIALPFSTQDQWELVPNKFDITTLKPFESRVLVRDSEMGIWLPDFFGCLDNSNECPYMVVGGIRWKYCIPFEGNEHLMGKADDCDDFYKNWE